MTFKVKVIDGSLKLREKSNRKSKVLVMIPNGTDLWVENTSQKDWLKTSYANRNGFVMAKYVEVPNQTHSTAENNQTNNAVNSSTTTLSYNRALAKAYAEKHSTSTKLGKIDPKANPKFGLRAHNDCANFVHQCLLAGGLKMFDGWCYKLPHIPKAWKVGGFMLTDKGRRALFEKGWIKLIAPEEVREGDIVYTFIKRELKQNENTRYSHVTLAVSDYDPSRHGCLVCGHTQNQHREFKFFGLDKRGKTVECYTINDHLATDGSEIGVDLT